MRTIKTDVFMFDELKPEAQKTAIEENRMINVDDASFWSDYIFDNWHEELEKKGYSTPKILYSGFGSQGDGACFTADVDIAEYLNAHKLVKKFPTLAKYPEAQTIKIEHNYRYYFATSTAVEFTFYGEQCQEMSEAEAEKLEKEGEEMTALIEAEREQLGNEIYKELSDEYFRSLEDDNVAETLRLNEYEFLSNGKRVLHV